MSDYWTTAVTAFVVTRSGPTWLLIRQRRLGVTKWELPGGHVEHGESLEQAASRECMEETGVRVDVGRLLATCVHEWSERRRRMLICFFDASPPADSLPCAPGGEPDIREAAWVDPLDLDAKSMSGFLHPLVDEQRHGWVNEPIHFRMEHRLHEGFWQPVPAS